ncbi:MAG: class I SAM-dependent methyltransferase [Chloroflexi bacterium]|nr:class I SAM-dependent methyltransferase [Chloroflexota bacterium]
MDDDQTRHQQDLQDGYDTVASEYAQRIADELDYKPFDRELLDRFAARLRDRGPVCDLGCGPGHVAHYLHQRGAQAFGLDLSPEMVAQARALFPQVEYRTGTMRALDAPDNAWAGIAAFYSIIHIPHAEVTGVLRELRRVLQPDGLLLVAFHIGNETVHIDEWWGYDVSLDFFFFERAEMEGYLREAGFVIEQSQERPPYEDVEHPSRRAYILARKPAQPG